MAAGQELLALGQWLIALLTSDAAFAAVCGARVYEGAAPEKDPATSLSPAYPLCVFNVQHARDTKAMGGKTVLTAVDLLVQVIGTGGYGQIQPADRRLQALLDAPRVDAITVDGDDYYMLGCTRTAPIQRPEFNNGVRYSYMGGIWRVDLQSV